MDGALKTGGPALIALQNDDAALSLSPELGGGVIAYRWRGREIFDRRPQARGPLALGCFVLAPFSGRIAGGCFNADGRPVRLAPNHPTEPDHPHALHGFDWLAPFEITETLPSRARLRRRHDGGGWPWPYDTEQVFTLTDDGYRHELSLVNRSDRPMTAGLGLHPFFPRDGAQLRLDVGGFWETTPDQIPTRWRALSRAPDWLGAAHDHCFTGRRGAIVIDWPTHRVTIEPDPAFSFTVVFTPEGEDYFCVEPVSHMPDAVNRAEAASETGLRQLRPGERWTTQTVFRVCEAAA